LHLIIFDIDHIPQHLVEFFSILELEMLSLDSFRKHGIKILDFGF